MEYDKHINGWNIHLYNISKKNSFWTDRMRLMPENKNIDFEVIEVNAHKETKKKCIKWFVE